MRVDLGSIHPLTVSPSGAARPPGRFKWLALGLVLLVIALVIAFWPKARYSFPRSGAPDPAFPLAVSANGRYLVSAQGKPWRLQSEFAWLLSTKATPADIDKYLADRKAKGFNAFTLLNLVRPGGTYGWPSSNVNGDAPFSSPNDLSQPNDAYFDYVDGLIDQAAAQGFAVLMFYTYAGYDGGSEGWFEIVAQAQNTKTVCYNFGRYLANRWKNKPNLVLMAGGDYTMPAGETRDRMHEIHRGLREGGCNQLGGSEWNGPDSLGTDQAGYSYGSQSASDLNLNSWYGQGPSTNGRVYETAERAWNATPTMPSYIEESMQGYGTYAPLDSTRPSIRKYQHWSVLAGGTAGTNWGMFQLANQFVDGQWQTQLNDVMAQDQARAHALYDSLPWWLMRPSGTGKDHAGRNLIVSTNNHDDTFISSSLTSDGMLLAAYVPPTGKTATTLRVDLRSMAGSSRARWWNPTSGSFTDITQGQYTLASSLDSQSFTTPGDNGTGSNDWLLILDAKLDANGGAGGAGSTGGSGNTGGTGNTAAGGRASSSGNAGGSDFTAGSASATGGSGNLVDPSAGGNPGGASVTATGSSGAGATGAGTSASHAGSSHGNAGTGSSVGTPVGGGAAQVTVDGSASGRASCSMSLTPSRSAGPWLSFAPLGGFLWLIRRSRRKRRLEAELST